MDFINKIKLDTDKLPIPKIKEKKTGLKINNIFETKGEIYFRDLEEKITLKLLKNKGKIISLGGGGFLNEKIRKEVLKNNLSFWLNWKKSTILNRIHRSKKRPIAFKLSENDLTKLINHRSKKWKMIGLTYILQ